MSNPIGIYVTYEEGWLRNISDTSGGGGPFSGYIECENFFNITGAYMSNPSAVTPYYDRVEKIFWQLPIKVFVILVRYSDGNTFGNTSGYGKIVAAAEYMYEAKEIRDKILKKEWHGYNVWEGYFARLEKVEIKELVVHKRIE